MIPSRRTRPPCPGRAARAGGSPRALVPRPGAVRDGADAHVVGERGRPAERSDNERLEFLGDAVLDSGGQRRADAPLPDRREGDLSRARAALVSESGLAQVALAIELGRFILLGKGEERTGGRSRPSILANALEALVGAVYLDAGFDAVGRASRRGCSKAARGRRCARAPRLQVAPAGARAGAVAGRARLRGGRPRTAPITTSGSRWRCRWPAARYGRAVGRSKKEAEQGAAAAALEALERGDEAVTRADAAAAFPRTCWRSAAGCSAPGTRRTWSAAACATCCSGAQPADFDVATDARAGGGDGAVR